LMRLVRFKGLKDTVSSVRKKSIGIKVCPRCGSTDVRYTTLTGYISQPTYVCDSCGFRSSIFLEADGKDLVAGMDDKDEDRDRDKDKKGVGGGEP